MTETEIATLHHAGETFYVNQEGKYYYMFTYNEKHRNWDAFTFNFNINRIILVSQGRSLKKIITYDMELTSKEEFLLNTVR